MFHCACSTLILKVFRCFNSVQLFLINERYLLRFYLYDDCFEVKAGLCKLRFLLWCGMGMNSSGMWHCVTGYLIPNIMRQCGGLTFMILMFHANLQILENGTTTLSKHQKPNTLWCNVISKKNWCLNKWTAVVAAQPNYKFPDYLKAGYTAV